MDAALRKQPERVSRFRHPLGDEWVVFGSIVALALYGFYHFGLESEPTISVIRHLSAVCMVALLVLHLRVKRRQAASPLPAGLTPPAPSRARDAVLNGGNNQDDVVFRLAQEFHRSPTTGAEENFNRQIRGLSETVNSAFVAHETCFYILDDARNTLVPRVFAGDRPSEPREIPLAGNWLEPVLLRSESIVHAADANEEQDYRSELAVPIVGVSENIGTLVVRSRTEQAFSSDDGSLLSSFADIISAAVINYNEIQSYESSARLFSSFYEISRELHQRKSFDEIITTLVNIIQRIFPFERISVSLMEENKRYGRIYRVIGQVDEFDEGYIFPLDEALNGWVMRRNRAALVQDLEHYDPVKHETFFRPRYTRQEKTSFGLRSFLSAPISYSEQCFGVVTVESRKPYVYSHRHEQVLLMLANNIAAALERSVIAEQLEQMAVTDEMTGLYNYRAFRQRLTEELLRADRYHNHFTLLIADIDHFKQFNDTHGHQTGDMVLKHVSRLIQSSVRSIDFTARYGGEEFAAILLGTKGEEARLTAERIRMNIESTPLEVDGERLAVTVSVGGADYIQDATTLQSIVDRADQALYQAKETGRNRVSMES